MTQGHLRSALTPGDAPGRPGRGALASHPARDLGPPPRPVRSRCSLLARRFSRDPRSWHQPSPRFRWFPRPRSAPKLRPRSSVPTSPSDRDPGPPADPRRPRAPRLVAPGLRAPSALYPPAPARFTHRDAGSLAVPPAPGSHPECEHTTSARLRPPLAPANQKPAAGLPGPAGSTLRARARGAWPAGARRRLAGAPELLDSRRLTLFVSDVRPGRPGWPGRALAWLPGRLPSLTARSPGSTDAAHAQALPVCWVRRGSMRRRVSFGNPPCR